MSNDELEAMFEGMSDHTLLMLAQRQRRQLMASEDGLSDEEYDALHERYCLSVSEIHRRSQEAATHKMKGAGA